jgi:hypothetical protein
MYNNLQKKLICWDSAKKFSLVSAIQLLGTRHFPWLGVHYVSH